ncbi:MAG: serine hydrolase [Candidatus Omnitrophota bacterium]
MKRKKIFLISASALVLLAVAVAAGSKQYQYLKQAKAAREVLNKRKASWLEFREELKKEVARYKGEAGIVVKDLRTGWKISFNEDRLFPSASLVKIPIMAACFQAAADGKIKLDQKITLRKLSKVSGSGILKNMPAGRKITVSRLIELMITQSDNTAANMLIDLLGFDYLNRYFRGLGLEKTNLSRKMMDFRYRRKGIENYTTPDDMAYILEAIYKRRLLGNEASRQCLDLLERQKYNDRIPARLPAGTVVAHKTGLERHTCHDVGIIFTEKGDLLISVLTKHPATSRLSKTFISRVALYAYNYYQRL